MKVSLVIGTLVLGTTIIQGPAGATWPAGASVTLPGYACNAPVVVDGLGNRFQECPYVSDSFHEGSDVGNIQVDVYAIMPSGGSHTDAFADVCLCQQSWTGSSVDCPCPDPGTVNTTRTSGYSALSMTFSSSPWSSTSVWDYYFVGVYWGGSTDTEVFGYSFHDQNG